MKIFKTRAELSAYLDTSRSQQHSIGFVPTMGALHQGHISLIDIARQSSDVVVCSIFVNPTQFNDPADLEKYPRPIESDIKKLEGVCDVLFMPDVNEMYEGAEEWKIDLGNLEHILEGRFRPGHYQGVTQIVKKLFDAVQPNKAYFGQKDYQQFKVIEKMTGLFKMPVELVMCPIVREADGLAMSSRNMHLSTEEHQEALALSGTLLWAKENFKSNGIAELRSKAIEKLNQSKGVDLDYFEICNAEDLHSVSENESGPLVALLAARVGKTRLIDNILLN